MLKASLNPTKLKLKLCHDLDLYFQGEIFSATYFFHNLIFPLWLSVTILTELKILLTKSLDIDLLFVYLFEIWMCFLRGLHHGFSVWKSYLMVMDSVFFYGNDSTYLYFLKIFIIIWARDLHPSNTLLEFLLRYYICFRRRSFFSTWKQIRMRFLIV